MNELINPEGKIIPKAILYGVYDQDGNLLTKARGSLGALGPWIMVGNEGVPVLVINGPWAYVTKIEE